MVAFMLYAFKGHCFSAMIILWDFWQFCLCYCTLSPCSDHNGIPSHSDCVCVCRVHPGKPRQCRMAMIFRIVSMVKTHPFAFDHPALSTDHEQFDPLNYRQSVGSLNLFPHFPPKDSLFCVPDTLTATFSGHIASTDFPLSVLCNDSELDRNFLDRISHSSSGNPIPFDLSPGLTF